MALTDTHPETQAAAAVLEGETAPAHVLEGVLGTGDHKTIGRLWIGFGVFMSVVALALSLVASIELIDVSSIQIFENEGELVQGWSLSRDLLLFGGVVPIFIGLATFLVPLQVGASSLAFPRGAAAAFWVWAISTDILILSYLLNGGPAGGRLDFTILWVLALGAMVASLLWAMVCVATTALGARAVGMTLERMPLASWSFLVFSLVGLFALPVMLGELVLAYLDLRYGFLPDEASRVALAEIVGGISSAPGVYFVGIPVLGIAADAIGVHTRRPVVFHRSVMASIGLFGFLAFGADFMSFDFRGREVAFDNAVLVVALLAAVLPVLTTLALTGESLGKGKPKVNSALGAALVSGVLLLAGVAAALMGAVDPIIGFIEELTGENITRANNLVATTFAEGIRGLILGAALLGGIAGVHHWGHKIWGHAPDDRLGFLTVLAALGGTVLWGVANIVNGFLDVEALPAVDTSISDTAEIFNVVSVVGVALLLGALVLLLLNVMAAAARRTSAVEPWTGVTLEWATSSPPPVGNFAEMPMVASATPLADLESDAASEEDA